MVREEVRVLLAGDTIAYRSDGYRPGEAGVAVTVDDDEDTVCLGLEQAKVREGGDDIEAFIYLSPAQATMLAQTLLQAALLAGRNKE